MYNEKLHDYTELVIELTSAIRRFDELMTLALHIVQGMKEI